MDNESVVLDTVEMIPQLMGELESKAFEEGGFSDITMNQMHYLETIAKLGSPTSADLAAPAFLFVFFFALWLPAL